MFSTEIMKNKTVDKTVLASTAEDRRMRQRQWGIAQKFKVLDHLYKLGHTFDQQPKHIF